MGNAKLITRLEDFEFEGKRLPVSYVSTLDVIKGVKCGTYTFIGDKSKDLGIIRIDPGCKTPLQKVLKGNKTIEGYISGKGRLTITKPDGEKEVYDVGSNVKNSLSVSVPIGYLMQWQADKKSILVVYEICYPPYEDGRYENIE